MIFGYVWKDPRAISEKTQRQHLLDAGASDQTTRIETSPSREWRKALLYGEGDKGYAKLRPGDGDIIVIYATRYLGDDSLDFVSVLCRLAELGAGLHVVDQGVTLFPDQAMADLIEQDIAERRKRQTENARKAKEKLPRKRRGGRKVVEADWSEEKLKEFRQWYAMRRRNLSDGEIAKKFEISKPAVKSVGVRLGLGERT